MARPRGPVPPGDWADLALAVGIVSMATMSAALFGGGWYLLLSGLVK